MWYSVPAEWAGASLINHSVSVASAGMSFSCVVRHRLLVSLMTAGESNFNHGRDTSLLGLLRVRKISKATEPH